MTKELLEKYLNNRCTSAEVETVIEWIKQQSFIYDSRDAVKADWQKSDGENCNVPEEKLDSLLDKIHHKLNIEELRIKQSGKRLLINTLSRAAAILIIPVFAFLGYILSENNRLTDQITAVSIDSLEVISPIGSRSVVELSDGSVVHLNFGSRIKYPQNFSGASRDITLSGEAYFEVAHNPEQPFVVSTGKINVKATGTKFNVNAYPENNNVATTLVEGKVVLEKHSPGRNPVELMGLKKGQHVNYNISTGKMVSSLGNIEKYIAWKDGKLVFENEPIGSLVQRLNLMFNVEIVVDKDVEKYKYTVTFIDEPLFQILELLSAATPIRYRALPRTKNPDGTFSKQKIIIEKKE